MSDIISNQIELLSNELLLIIFEYLDVYTLVKAFYGLNRRIDALLRSANLHISFDSSNNDKTIWDILALSINPLQIRSLLSFENVNINERFLSFITENLRVLYLHGMHQFSMNQIFQHIPVNNQIKCLCINQGTDRFDDYSPQCSLIDFALIDHGHRFTALVYLSLQFKMVHADISVVSIIFPHLRRLEMDIYMWSSNIFRFLQDNTPNLRSLKLTESFETFGLSTDTDFVLKHIHEFHIYYEDDLESLQTLLSKFPCLRRLYINWNNERCSWVADGAEWQDLIEKYLPHLQQLTIDFDEGIDKGILDTFHTGEFWSMKQINAKMIVDKTLSRYRLVKTIYVGIEWHFEYLDWCEIQAQTYGSEIQPSLSPSTSRSRSSLTSRSSSTSDSTSLTPSRLPGTRRTHSQSSLQSRARTPKRLRFSSTS